MAGEQQTPAAQPTVLVIDDEDYVADMIASALEVEGLIAHVAYNGREGLSQAQTIAADLLIIDIMMPYMSGIELITRVRALAHHAGTPVLLISAGARPRKSLPNVTFVSKPFDMNMLTDLALARVNGQGEAQ